MTVTEFSLEFDLLYDNLASRGAPGIDEYEKSVYLTKGQLEIVKQYNSNLNKYSKSFDGSEKRRVDLKELIEDYKTTDAIVNSNAIDSKLISRFYTIPDDVFLIKLERGYIEDVTCGQRQLSIIPITLDEFNEKIRNPFRKPNKDRGWRVDYNSPDLSNNNSVEIITSELLDSYHIRYVKYPEPIILTDISAGDFVGMGLSIDGQTAAQTCLLNKEIHREILDRAVELAILDYKQNNLQNKVEINSRNN